LTKAWRFRWKKIETSWIKDFYARIRNKFAENLPGLHQQFQELATEAGLWEKANIPTGTYEQLLTILNKYTTDMDAHVGDHTVEKKDEKTWMEFKKFDVLCTMDVGDISYIGGVNGTGKTNLQVCIMLDLAMRKSDPFTPYKIFTNVGLTKKIFAMYNVIKVSRMSQVFREIAEDYIHDRYFVYLLFLDEWDNTINSYKAISRDTKNFMNIFVQIRKIDLAMNCVVHYFSDITHKHRKGNMLCYIQKGSWYPQNMTGIEDAIQVSDKKKGQRTAAIWWQDGVDNITEIPNMAQYFRTLDNTKFKLDFEPGDLFEELGEMKPIDDTPKEKQDARHMKGRIILDFLDSSSGGLRMTDDQGEAVRTWRVTDSWKETTRKFNVKFNASLNHDTLRMRFVVWDKTRKKPKSNNHPKS